MMKALMVSGVVGLGLAVSILLPASGAAENSDQDWRQSIEKKLDILTSQMEKSHESSKREPSPAIHVAPYSMGLGASKVYGIDPGLSIAGYGELVYQNFRHPKADSLVDNEQRISEIDMARFVLYAGYKFSDKILFDSELEVEHTNSSKSGEVGVEFAFLDFALSGPLGLRVGKLLVPMGLINEYHEPPYFNSALRPDLERFIIPTTWAENGAGFYGEYGPLAYRGYVIAGLRAARDPGMNQNGMQPDIGLLESRQEGSRSRMRDLAYVQRLDYVIPGFLMGGSIFTGNAGQEDSTPAGVKINAPVTLWDLHARCQFRGLDMKAIYAQATVGGVNEIDQANGLSGNQSVGQVLWGGYVEAAYDLLGLFLPYSSQSLSPFFRYERLNTQASIPYGYSADPANDRINATFGISYKPVSKVVLKGEYQLRANNVGTGIDQFNLAAGYQF